jgi:hypothetical protein
MGMVALQGNVSSRSLAYHLHRLQILLLVLPPTTRLKLGKQENPFVHPSTLLLKL